MKYKSICFLACMILGMMCCAQDSIEKRNLKFGFELYPKITYMKILSSNLEEPQSIVTSAAGVSIRYIFWNKASFRSGLRISNTTFNTRDYYSVMWPSDQDGNGGFDPFKSWTLHTASTFYIGIPLKIRQELSDRFYFSAGTNLLVPVYSFHSLDTYFKDLSSSTKIPVSSVSSSNQIGLNINLGLGFIIARINSNNIFIEPEVQYGLFGKTKAEVVSTLLSSSLEAKQGFTYGVLVGFDF